MRIGVDLGGTKIEGILLAENGEQIARERIATPSHSYAAVVEAIAGLVEGLQTHATGTATVGLGGPGAISTLTGLIKNSNTLAISGHALPADLGKRLGYEVRFSNDANCFALSEAVDGAGSEYPTVFGVILGTGTGGGVVVNKQVLVGANSIAGEWGHNPMPRATEERVCYCGRINCIETYLCGGGLAKSYSNAGGESIKAPEIAKRAAAGEALADAVLDNYCRQLARALSGVINLLDPAVIVLGGGVSNVDIIYEKVPQYWSGFVFSDSCETKLVKAKYGDSSGVRGAAWLW
ncbi:ROK family protein [Zhongshania sp. BJYM1]|uniref:ROK family protein n=1 Tax=Zhongshania aquatica TaxID=2965069 RepID=UPI0022B4F223|nr:ROK family protein [Marortus sp. BJYM1]